MYPHVRYRMLAVVFAAGAVWSAALFVGGLAESRVRTGLLFYFPLFCATAAGLWLGASWGRSLALLTGLTGAGFGALSLVASLLSPVSPLGPAILFVTSVLILAVAARTPLPHG